MSFRVNLQNLFETFGYSLKAADGLTESVLDRQAKKLGIALPSSLKTLYELAGREKRFTRCHNRLLHPADWSVSKGRLIFFDENQSVCCWGVSVRSASADPPVSQGMGDEDEGYDWRLEHRKFSTFILGMLHFQAVMGGMAYCGMLGPIPNFKKAFAKGWKKYGPIGGGSAFSRPGQVIYSEVSTGNFAGARTKQEFEMMAESLGTSPNLF
jgi:hypothetical protein